jgi:hypothetical protein
MGNCRVRLVEGADKVYLDGLGPLGGIRLADVLRLKPATGVGNNNVNAAMNVCGMLEQRLHRSVGADVCHTGTGRTAAGLGQRNRLVNLVAAARTAHHRGASLGICQCDGAADAAPGACDNGNLAGEGEILCVHDGVAFHKCAPPVACKSAPVM